VFNKLNFLETMLTGILPTPPNSPVINEDHAISTSFLEEGREKYLDDYIVGYGLLILGD
jgi:hypothetical protein